MLDRIQPSLATLLALSANSPFWQGVDSADASFRYQAWGTVMDADKLGRRQGAP